MPLSPSPKTRKCGSAPKSTATGPRSLCASPIAMLAVLRQFVVPHQLGQQPHRRRLRSGPRRRDRGDQVVVGRRGGEEMEAVRGQAASRRVLGNVGRRLAGHQGVGRVAEPQFQPGAEQVAHGRPEVHPAGGRGQHVDAVGQAAGGQVDDGRLRGPRTRRGSWPSRRSRGRCRSRPARALAPSRSRAVSAAAMSPTVRRTASGSSRPGHAADVRQVAHPGQRAAAEVEAVELDLGRGVGQRTVHKGWSGAGWTSRCAGRPRSPRARPAPDRFSHSSVPNLVERLVHERDRHLQATAQRGVDGRQAEHRVGGQRARQLGEAARTGPTAAATPGAPATPAPASRSTITSSRVGPVGSG